MSRKIQKKGLGKKKTSHRGTGEEFYHEQHELPRTRPKNFARSTRRNGAHRGRKKKKTTEKHGGIHRGTRRKMTTNLMNSFLRNAHEPKNFARSTRRNRAHRGRRKPRKPRSSAVLRTAWRNSRRARREEGRIYHEPHEPNEQKNNHGVLLLIDSFGEKP